jgi:hypothetical protein
MRERFRRPFRPRKMARRHGDEERFSLSPRARRIGGWLAALLIILAVAMGVRIFGSADGAAGPPDPSATDAADPSRAIVFGTAIDWATGEVSEASRTARFADGDTFAYSVPPAGPPPETVYVEVRRGQGGEVVQAPAAQPLPEGAAVIAFSVPAANLLRDFGEGTFEMRIYLEPQGAPFAVGSFELIQPVPSASVGGG